MKHTKDLILKTAKKLFAKNGLTETTMDEVAGDARIGKGTIYHYFKSKEQMYSHILDDDMANIRQELTAVLNSESEPDKKLRAYILGRMRSMLKFSSLYIMFKQDYIDYYGYIKKTYDKYLSFELESIKSCLKEGMEKSIFRVDDLEFTTYAIAQGIKGLEYYFASEKEENIPVKVNILADIWLTGLMKAK
jgi:AcrR family transcriptional regulator